MVTRQRLTGLQLLGRGRSQTRSRQGSAKIGSTASSRSSKTDAHLALTSESCSTDLTSADFLEHSALAGLPRGGSARVESRREGRGEGGLRRGEGGENQLLARVSKIALHRRPKEHQSMVSLQFGAEERSRKQTHVDIAVSQGDQRLECSTQSSGRRRTLNPSCKIGEVESCSGEEMGAGASKDRGKNRRRGRTRMGWLTNASEETR